MKTRMLSKFNLFYLGVFAVFVIRYFCFGAPSEAQMLAKFHQHKTEFEQIRLMLNSDKIVKSINRERVAAQHKEANGFINSEEIPLNISENRIALYRLRLRNLGFSQVISDRGKIRLDEFGGGFADTTWSIGYVWCAERPSPLVKSAYSEMPMRDHECFSPIEDNWYLYQRR